MKHSAFRPAEPSRDSLRGFVQADGYASIEAEQYTHKDESAAVGWQKIDDYDAPCPRRRYFLSRQKARCHPPTRRDSNMRCTCSTPAKVEVEVEAIVAPTLNVVPGRGLRYAISFDDQPPQVIDAPTPNTAADWAQAAEDSARQVKSTHVVKGAGYHTLKF